MIIKIDGAGIPSDVEQIDLEGKGKAWCVQDNRRRLIIAVDNEIEGPDDIEAGQFVEVSIEWAEHLEKTHMLITFLRIVEDGQEAEGAWSELIKTAPRQDRPGGFRGTQGRKPTKKERLHVMLPPEDIEQLRQMANSPSKAIHRLLQEHERQEGASKPQATTEDENAPEGE